MLMLRLRRARAGSESGSRRELTIDRGLDLFSGCPSGPSRSCKTPGIRASEPLIETEHLARRASDLASVLASVTGFGLLAAHVLGRHSGMVQQLLPLLFHAFTTNVALWGMWEASCSATHTHPFSGLEVHLGHGFLCGL